MATAIALKQPASGLTATGYYGFSWTSFFFSGIPAIMRGDLGVGLGVLAASTVGGVFSLSILLFVVNIVWAFVYNTAGITLAVTGVLNPIMAAGAMALSSLSVIANSRRL